MVKREKLAAGAAFPVFEMFCPYSTQCGDMENRPPPPVLYLCTLSRITAKVTLLHSVSGRQVWVLK